MAAWNNGKVVGRKQWSKTLYSLYVESDIAPFEAGQFIKMGLEIKGEILGRPYSLVNPPDSRPLEIYYTHVPDGRLTSQLIQLKPGDDIFVAPRAHGFLILSELPKADHLWLMATGTGVGPFISMLATETPWQHYKKTVLVYAARTFSELSYQEHISNILAKHAEQFIFIPFLSRETKDNALHGRIPQAIIDGTLEVHAAINISAENSQIMLCGNPQMVKDTSKVLNDRGLKKHRRVEPGHITIENYW